MKRKELFQKTLKNYIGITEYVANIVKCVQANNFNIFDDIMKAILESNSKDFILGLYHILK